MTTNKLIIDLEKGIVFGMARAGDIKRYGLIAACLLNESAAE